MLVGRKGETPDLDSGAREEEGELETAKNKPGLTDEDWKIFDRILENKFGKLPTEDNFEKNSGVPFENSKDDDSQGKTMDHEAKAFI